MIQNLSVYLRVFKNVCNLLNEGIRMTVNDLISSNTANTKYDFYDTCRIYKSSETNRFYSGDVNNIDEWILQLEIKDWWIEPILNSNTEITADLVIIVKRS